jgi:hypothetical protein
MPLSTSFELPGPEEGPIDAGREGGPAGGKGLGPEWGLWQCEGNGCWSILGVERGTALGRIEVWRGWRWVRLLVRLGLVDSDPEDADGAALSVEAYHRHCV